MRGVTHERDLGQWREKSGTLQGEKWDAVHCAERGVGHCNARGVGHRKKRVGTLQRGEMWDTAKKRGGTLQREGWDSAGREVGHCTGRGGTLQIKGWDTADRERDETAQRRVGHYRKRDV